MMKRWIGCVCCLAMMSVTVGVAGGKPPRLGAREESARLPEALEATSAAIAREPSFTRKPSAEKAGETVKITFSVSAAADVEVAVLDAGGKIVCHLAAGVLGGANRPPAPLKPGLAQTVLWDGKDDFGGPAVGGPFKVRVRAGMKPVFDGFIGASPYALAGGASHAAQSSAVRGMVVDGQGNLYVLEQAYDLAFPGPNDIRVYDHNGRYLRTIMPYAATLRREEAAKFGLIDAPGEFLVPKNGPYGVWPRFYPLPAGPGGWTVPKLSAVTRDGTLILHDERMVHGLYRIRASDGAAVGAKFPEAVWPAGYWHDKNMPFHPNYDHVGSAAAALSPDGQTLYVAGFGGLKAGRRDHTEDATRPDWPDTRVYKMRLDRLGRGLERFVDVPRCEGAPRAQQAYWFRYADWTAVQGLAVDGKGDVYVCDTAGGRVRKYSPEGKEISSVAVSRPYQAAVDDRTGALYVVNRDVNVVLVKLSGCDEKSAVLARLELPHKYEARFASISGSGKAANHMAVDFSGARPQIWLANQGKDRDGLLRIEDWGAELKVIEDLNDRDKFALRKVDRIAVGPETDDIYVSDGYSDTRRYSGVTGQYNGAVKDGRPQPIVATDTTVGPDGYVYIQQGPSFAGAYQRLDRDLKPAPLKVTGKDTFGFVYGRQGAAFCTKGSCVGWDGRVYSLGMLHWCEYYVASYTPDGRAVAGPRTAPQELVDAVKSGKEISYGLQRTGITSALIGKLTVDNGGVKVDRAGNVYVGMAIRPADHKPPAGFEKDEVYNELVGSVVKFGPQGGGPKQGKEGGRGTSGTRSLADYEGVVRVYPGFGSFSGGDRRSCCCRSPRFDLDPYGRLYLPNTITFDVRVVDNAGNEICKFGHYGNCDSQWVPEDSKDGKPLVATPDIPLGWPLSVGASEKKIYVGDLYNRRVVRVDKKYSAEAMCEVK